MAHEDLLSKLSASLVHIECEVNGMIGKVEGKYVTWVQ